MKQPLTAAAACRLLEDTYRLGWFVEHRRSSPSRTAESRDGVAYELTATLVEVIARRVA